MPALTLDQANRIIAEGVILSAVYVAEEHVAAMGIIETREAASARVIVEECKCADSIVVAGNAVIYKSVGSNGGILYASGIEQQRSSAHCGVGASVV